jgi:hypothetical protein
LEAVLQHLEGRHHVTCDGENNRELARDNPVGRLDPSLKRTDDRGARVADEDVLDIESDGLGQCAQITDEINDRLASAPASNPRKRANIALDLKEKIGVEQGSNAGRILTTANPLQNLLCESDVLLTTHWVPPFGVCFNLLMPRARATIRRIPSTELVGRRKHAYLLDKRGFNYGLYGSHQLVDWAL